MVFLEKIKQFGIIAPFALFPSSAYAAESSLLEMLNSFKAQVPSIETFLFGFAFIIGIALIASSFFKFAKVGSGQSQETIGQALTVLVVGVLMVSLASFIDATEATLGIGENANSLLSYVQNKNGADYKSAVEAAFLILKPFGFIAVFRGVLLFKDAAERRGDATPGKAMTHIVGGVVLANAGWGVCTLAATFGSSLCG